MLLKCNISTTHYLSSGGLLPNSGVPTVPPYRVELAGYKKDGMPREPGSEGNFVDHFKPVAVCVEPVTGRAENSGA
jgi:hypothetical protein